MSPPITFPQREQFCSLLLSFYWNQFDSMVGNDSNFMVVVNAIQGGIADAGQRDFGADDRLLTLIGKRRKIERVLDSLPVIHRKVLFYVFSDEIQCRVPLYIRTFFKDMSVLTMTSERTTPKELERLATKTQLGGLSVKERLLLNELHNEARGLYTKALNAFYHAYVGDTGNE